MSKIIGICGLAGSGKDTVADMICKKYENWKEMAFADALKDAVSVLFGWDRNMVYGKDGNLRKKREEVDKFWAKELGIDNFTPRVALQMIGTDVFRNHFNDKFWLICLKKKIKDNIGHTVITDVRFPNEMEMIREMGGQIIQVIRGELPQWYKEAEEINIKMKELPYLNKNLLIEQSSKLSDIHPSEYSLAGLIDADYVIHNDGSLSDLEKSVEKMMAALYD